MNTLRTILIVPFLAFIAACDSNGSNPSNVILPDEEPSANDSVLVGSGNLGVIKRGIVNISDTTGEILATSITNENGDYGPVVISSSHTGSIIIELSPATDGSSFFLCDFASGCPDPSNAGVLIPFGDDVPFTATLSAVLADETMVDQAYINPLTTAIRARAEALGGVDRTNVTQADAEMAAALTQLLGTNISASVSSIPNVDLVNPFVNSTDQQLIAAGTSISVLNAGLIASVSTESGLGDIDAVVNELAAGFAASGKFGISEPGSFSSGEVNVGEILVGVEAQIDALTSEQPETKELIENLLENFSLGELAVNASTVRNDLAPIAPTISGSPVLVVKQDDIYEFAPVSFDEDGDDLAFSIENKPTWATFNKTTGKLSGKPGNSNVGVTSNVQISVSDGTSSSSLESFTLEVVNVNDAPVFIDEAIDIAIEDLPYQSSVSATDIDPGAVLVYGLSNQPEWLEINPVSGDLSGIPNNSDVGAFSNIVASVTDGIITVTMTFDLQVSNVNDEPVITASPVGEATQGETYGFAVFGSDIDVGDELSFSIFNNPSWMEIDSVTGVVSGTPANSDVGTTKGVFVSVSDGTVIRGIDPFDVVVANINDAPEIFGNPAPMVDQDMPYTAQFTGSDIDVDDRLTYSIENNPPWLSVDVNSGEISGVPANADVGVASSVIVSVSDGTTSTSFPVFSVTVKNVNDAPTISGAADIETLESVLYSVDFVANDIDVDDTLVFSVENKPTWLSLGVKDSKATLSGTPTDSDVGIYSDIKLTVTDTDGLFDSIEAFSLEVINVRPTISGAPEEPALEDALFSFTPSSSGGHEFSINDKKPSWAVFNAETGEISGIPGNADVGTYTDIRITVKDSNESSSLDAFDIEVLNTNDSPTGRLLVTGTITEDETLGIDSSSVEDDDGVGIFAYQWNRNRFPVAGQTSTTYLLGDDDVGQSISVTGTYTDSRGTLESVTSVATSAIVNVNDELTGVLAISGTPLENQVLVADTSALADDDGFGAFSYQWQRGSEVIEAAVEASYIPVDADVGSKLQVQITYTDLQGTVEGIASDVTDVVVNVNDSPKGELSVEGIIREDEELRVSSTVTDEDGLGVFAYQWQRSGLDIPGANSATYTPRDSEVGFPLAVRATFTDGFGFSESVESSVTSAVENINDVPTGRPTIVSGPTKGFGLIEEGQELVAATETIADNDGLGLFSYQWRSNGLDIASATNEIYKLQAADVGSAISLNVIYEDAQGTEESLVSADTGIVEDILTIDEILSVSVPKNEGPAPLPRQTVYYVDQNHPSANDANDGLSEEFPWLTLTKAYSSVGAGDFVYIKGDVDPESADAIYHRPDLNGFDIKTPGAPGQITVYRNFPGTKVIVQGDGSRNGIELDHASYHHFYGFTVRKFRKATEGFAVKSDITIENSEFTQNSINGMRLRYITNLVLRDLYVHHNFEAGVNILFGKFVVVERVESAFNDDGRGTDGDGDGFHVEPGENVIFIDTYAHDNSEDGYDVQMNGVMYNIVSENHPASNIKTWRRDNSSDLIGATVPPFDTEEIFAEKLVYIINAVVRNAGQTGIKQSNGAAVNIYNSVIDNNNEEGIAFRAPAQHSLPATTSRIANTIMSNNGESGIELSSGSIVIENNNLFFNNGSIGQGPTTGFDVDSTAVTEADPVYLAPGSADYRLQSASPAIDKGAVIDISDINAKLLDIDKFGNKRPSGIAPDIGIFERASNAGGSPSVFTGPDVLSYTIDEGESLDFNLSGSDPDGDGTSFLALETLPTNASLDNKTGAFTFTPDSSQGGNTAVPSVLYELKFAITDGFLTEPLSTLLVNVSVSNVNRDPIYSGLSEYTMVHNRPFHIRVLGADPDGDTVKFEASNLPPGLTIDTDTGEIYGIPSSEGSFASTISLVEVSSSTSTATSVLLRVMPTAIASPTAPIRIVSVANNSELNAAIADAKAGDRIELAAGVYNGVHTVKASGTASNPIVFTPADGANGLVTFDGVGLSSPEVMNFSDGASHIIIDGFSIQNYSETFFMRSTHENIQIINTTISDSLNAIRGNSINGLRVENLTVSNMTARPFSLGSITNAHFFNVSVTATPEMGFSFQSGNDNVQILNSTVSEAALGLFIDGQNFHLRNLKLVNSGFGIDGREGSSVISINNLIANISGSANSAGVLMRNNSWGVFEHNTFVQIEDIGLNFAVMSYLRLQNSLVADTGAAVVRYTSGGPSEVLEKNNAFDQTLFDFFTPDISSLIGDPLFTDPTTNNFRLKPESPFVDVGITLPYVFDDLEGTLRNDGSYDIGALEN